MNKIKSPRGAKLKALLFVPLMTALMLAFAGPRTLAQSAAGAKPMTVKGQVTEKTTGEGLQGCAVVIKGTTIGTLSGPNGEYSLEVSEPDAKLVFSFIGFETEEIPVGTHTKINVELQENVMELDFSRGNQMMASPDQEQKSSPKTDAKADHNEMYVAVESNPSYPGGTDALLKFLKENLKYPEAALKNKVEGTVVVQYTIDSKGNIKLAKVMRGISPELDQEALRVTNLITGWKPGMQNNKPIARVVTMPVQFILP